VKGKSSKVDVYAPILAIDVAAALALRPPPRTASHLSRGGLSLAAAGSSPGVGMVAPGPAPPGIILGGLGGGGVSSRIPPLPVPAVEALSVVEAVTAPPAAVQASRGSGGGSSAARRRGALLKDGGSGGGGGDLSLDDSSRYRLESPRKGNWQGGARRGSVMSSDGSVSGKEEDGVFRRGGWFVWWLFTVVDGVVILSTLGGQLVDGRFQVSLFLLCWSLFQVSLFPLCWSTRGCASLKGAENVEGSDRCIARWCASR